MKRNLSFHLIFQTGLGRCLMLALLLCGSVWLGAQKTKKDLYHQKSRALKEISETHRILKQTRKQKKATIGQLNAIKKQIDTKEVLIGSINEEVQTLEEEIRELEIITTSMEQDLEDLKQEYAKMVYAASKVSGKYDKLMFLFSSSTFDQMLMRLKYMKFYGETRKDQLININKVRQALIDEKEIMQGKKVKKTVLLEDNIKEKQSLEVLKSDKDKIAKELSSKEKELKKEIDAKKKAVRDLERIIE
ncbi:MAG TPA: hypothetical protein VL947_03385, partial [Cytophagales bacterium]|nr:hypothetical protein [Cytophagales bacterium]